MNQSNVLKRWKGNENNSYTTSPVHNIKGWVDLSQNSRFRCFSLAIKDMAGLLKPYVAFELVSSLKENLSSYSYAESCHTGMSTATGIKAIELGWIILMCLFPS